MSKVHWIRLEIIQVLKVGMSNSSRAGRLGHVGDDALSFKCTSSLWALTPLTCINVLTIVNGVGRCVTPLTQVLDRGVER